MSFPCTSCGACCRRAGSVEFFPEPVRDDGTCSHLTPDDRCAIYDRRPFVCDHARGHAAFSDLVTLAEWHAMNAEACNAMQLQDGIHARFRLPVLR